MDDRVVELIELDPITKEVVIEAYSTMLSLVIWNMPKYVPELRFACMLPKPSGPVVKDPSCRVAEGEEARKVAA